MGKNSPETLAKRNALKREWHRKLKGTNFPKFIRKRCKNCGRIKLCQWNSSFTQAGIPEYKSKCKECHLNYLRCLRKTDKGRHGINVSRRKSHLRRKKWAIDLLGGKCKKCGYDKCIAALTFHHRNQQEKEYGISTILDWDKSTLEAELKKCDVLCFNCHMEEHYNKGG